MEIPKVLNLGSGKDFRPDCINIDNEIRWGPDILHDLNSHLLKENSMVVPGPHKWTTNSIKWTQDILQYPKEHLLKENGIVKHTKRFGEIRIERGTIKKIIANDVLEHIQELTTCMRSCVELLEENGLMEILVPYDMSLGAWQDPTHVRAFNEMSWTYYNAWAKYLGWNKERLVIKELNFLVSDYGKGLMETGISLRRAILTPRAIDSMKVVLQKKTIGEDKR